MSSRCVVKKAGNARKADTRGSGPCRFVASSTLWASSKTFTSASRTPASSPSTSTTGASYTTSRGIEPGSATWTSTDAGPSSWTRSGCPDQGGSWPRRSSGEALGSTSVPTSSPSGERRPSFSATGTRRPMLGVEETRFGPWPESRRARIRRSVTRPSEPSWRRGRLRGGDRSGSRLSPQVGRRPTDPEAGDADSLLQDCQELGDDEDDGQVDGGNDEIDLERVGGVKRFLSPHEHQLA